MNNVDIPDAAEMNGARLNTQSKDFIGVEDSDKSDNLYNELLVEEEADSKTFYLDEKNNFVSKEQAIRSVTQTFDADGKMISERWAELRKDEKKDNVEYKTVFTDENGNEVDENLAVNIEFRKYVNNELIVRDSYPMISKKLN